MKQSHNPTVGLLAAIPLIIPDSPTWRRVAGFLLPNSPIRKWNSN
jgi:hypothetical protein